MAPRSRPQHPQERRARRIRVAVLSCFAAFLLLALLAVAAYGLMIGRTTHPVAAAPAISADGVLLLNLDRVISQIPSLEIEGAPPGSDYLREEMRAMRTIFASSAQVFLWDADPSLNLGQRWALFLPIIRPHSLFLRRLEKTLADSNVLPREGEPVRAAGPHIAYYRLMREGLLLSSDPIFPDITFRPADDPISAEALYMAPRGYLPPFLLEALGPPADPGGDCAGLEIRWAPPGAAGELLITRDCPDGARDTRLPHTSIMQMILSSGEME